MARKGKSTEEIIGCLREAEVRLGRPPGSRNKLVEDFISDFAELSRRPCMPGAMFTTRPACVFHVARDGPTFRRKRPVCERIDCRQRRVNTRCAYAEAGDANRSIWLSTNDCIR